MLLNIAVQMDPMESIHPESDSTLILMREAARRGHSLWHYTPDKLTWRDAKITAEARRILFKHSGYALGKPSVIDLKTMNVVLLRQDPPFDMNYLTTTYILEQLPAATLVVNHPKAVRDFPEKIMPTRFKKYMPPTLITADGAEIERFWKTHRDIVVKPLYGHGGRGVFRIGKKEANLPALIEMQFKSGPQPLMAQKFLPQVATGDRRVIMVDGKVEGVVGRIPLKGEIRANFRVGGRGVKAVLTRRQKDICDALGPVLKKHGLVFAGVDLIGDWLTEVNLTSPTGLAVVKKLYGTKPEAAIWNAVERRASA